MRPFNLAGRRNRDRPVLHLGGSSDFMDSALALPAPGFASSFSFRPSQFQGAQADGRPARDSLEGVIERGHRWLRFPSALEAAFQAEIATSRRLMLLVGALIGIAAFWVGSVFDDRLMTDLPDLQAQIRVAILAFMVFSVAGALMIPPSRRQNWHYEALTLTNTLVINGALVYLGMVSSLTTSLTHTQSVVLVVMYAGLAARQRFWWTFTSASLTLLAYAVFVRATTPVQQLIVDQNIKLMLVSFLYTLAPNYVFEYGERRAWLLRQLDAKRRMALVEAGERLRMLSRRDPLTGLYNRRHFDHELNLALAQAAKEGRPVSALMVDVDHFKLYNDSHGHPAGDACLQRVAAVLSRLAEDEGGVAGRLGGEEFALFLIGRTGPQARMVGERLCQAVRALMMDHLASPVAPHVTVSVGVAALVASEAPHRAAPWLLAAADRALYRAKAGGRDRATVADEVVLGHADGAVQGGEAPPQPQPQPPSPSPSEPAMPRQDAAGISSHDLERVLNSGRAWWRFPPLIEAAYQTQQAAARRKHLFCVAWLGLLCINAYVLHSRAMFADIPEEALYTMLKVSGLLACLTPLLLAPLPGWLRELLYAEGICVMALTGVHILSRSSEVTAYSFLTSLLFLPLFAGVVGRQSLWCTVATVVATLGPAAWWLEPKDAMQALVLRDTLFLVVTASLFTLVAACTLERGARRQWLLGEMERLDRAALTTATRRLHGLSMQDPLTGLSNRRRFEADFARVWSQSRQRGAPVSLLIIDVDHFKLFNDGYGHPAGDRCLQQVATVLGRAAQDAEGLAARLGGEEFAILLPGMGAAQASRVGEQVCEAVRQANLEHRHAKGGGRVTISVGVACSTDQLDNARHLLAAADDAVYAAKTAGRDRVALHQAA